MKALVGIVEWQHLQWLAIHRVQLPMPEAADVERAISRALSQQ